MNAQDGLPSKWPALSLTAIGGLLRILPHPPNLAPVGAMSLFAGARLRGWKAYALPLALMAITDPLLGGYSIATPLVYASFMLNVYEGSSVIPMPVIAEPKLSPPLAERLIVLTYVWSSSDPTCAPLEAQPIPTPNPSPPAT